MDILYIYYYNLLSIKLIINLKLYNNMESLVRFIETWLSDNNVHLATHSGANYHYLTSNDFDYTGYSSFQSSIEEAIKDESIFVSKDNHLHICEKVINLSVS